MRTFYKILVLAIASTMCTTAMAQVSAYLFSQPSGAYVPITGGTVIATATDNIAPGNLGGGLWNLPSGTFPFPFVFNGTPYTGCNISGNGFITFGNVAPTGAYSTPISGTTAYDGAIAAWGRGISGMYNIGTGPFYTSELRVEILGAAPHRTAVIQYDNWRCYAATTTITLWVMDFQIRLTESSNIINVVYGPGIYFGTSSWSTIGFTCQVGLRGATNADFNNRTNSTAVSFAASTAGAANNASQANSINSSVGTGIPGMPPNGLTYKWDPGCVVNITSSGNNSLAPVICSGSSLTLSTDAVSNYTWSTGNTTNTSIVVTPTNNTTYSITGTSTANCVASAFINVTVSSGVPTLAVAASTTQVCLGKTVTLTASGAVTYTWTGGITNGVSFTPNSTTTYTVNGQNGCGTSTSFTTINVTPLSVNAATSPGTVCAGSISSATITAAANSYTWQPINATTSGSVFAVSPSVTTVYTVTASDGTCSGVTNITVTANPLPTISPVVSPTMICPGESVTLTVSGGINYTWTAASIGGSVLVANPTITSVYFVSGDNSIGCIGNSAPVVIVGLQPTLSVNSSSSAVCAGGSSTLTVTGADTYDWTGGPPTNTYVVTPGQHTVYNVTGTTTSSGCTDTETISVDVFNPVMSITGNTAICSGATTDFTAAVPGAILNSYVWNPGNILFPVATGLSPAITTMYTVTAQSSSLGIACPVAGMVQVVVNPNPTITATGSDNPIYICRYGTTTLTASGASNYVWSNSTSTLGTSPTLTVTSPIIGIITMSVTGTNALSCTDTRIVSVAVNACNGIDEASKNISGLIIYPNPNNGEFMIESTFETELALVNELGQLVKRIKLSEQTGFKYSVSDLPGGIYFITNTSQANRIKEKIIVTKN